MLIDSHAHFWHSYMSMDGPDINVIIRGMEDTGIDMTYINSLSAIINTDTSPGNREVYDITVQYPDLFRGLAVVTPYAGQKALDELERCLTEYKFIGLKLHPWMQGYYANADFLDPLFDICRSYDVPVQFHTGTPPYTQVFQVACQAARHPDVRIVFSHMGLNYQWRDCIDVGKRYKNTYFESCGISYVFAIERIIRELGAHRVMFGTDNPFLFPKTELLKLEDISLSDTDLEWIYHKTAEEAFRQ